MSRTLLEITPQYSSFVDDQVLTSAKLNEFMEYFDEQDKLTRVCLTGVGVACGFTVKLNKEAPSITILQGCGITSDGDLLKLQRDIEDLQAPKGKSFKDIQEMVAQLTYTHYKTFADEHAEYAPFRNGSSVIDIKELITDFNAPDDSEGISLTPTLLADKVVVLYLECYAKPADICTTTNCDNQGQPNIQNVKALLIDKEDVISIVNNEDTIFNKHDVYEAILALPSTAVEKVILNADFGINNNISEYSKLAKAYTTKITSAKNVLNAAYSGLFDGFSEILDISNGVRNTVLNQIDDLDNFNNAARIQYRYDLTKDISDTYNEIAKLLLQLKSECCPNINSFPKHLLLGCLDSEKVYPELRHDFYHAPVNNGYATIVKQAKSLVNRVRILLDNFNLHNTQEVLITPSINCGDLGEKAIPAYYDVDASFLRFWDFKKTQNYKQNLNVSYHKGLLAAGSWVQNPLNFQLDGTNFYRIEGHLGMSPSQGITAIETIKKEYALDFDIVEFDINEDAQAFTSFVKNNPSILHKAGVDKGGTFVILSNKEEILADFCVSYKIAAKGNEQGCCSLMECTFPWISSLKYLNNLSRSLNGTQSRRKFMPQNYTLDIIEYKINGEQLINRTVRITIPLSQIFLRRMHAITDALNSKFDKGVVFDFNENQKRFVITRAKEDRYVIRLRDATLGSNPIYTYSNTGMYRNDKIFRPDAMRCRDLKSYNPSFYEKLHAQIAPVNKDDDYGTYDDKWAKWYLLRDRLVTNPFFEEAKLKRMITSASELPDDLKTTLRNLKRDFDAVASEANVKLAYQLDGDWVNGVWVNDAMLTYRRENIKNTHDDIVLFINLRKFLHNETGVTKLSIYITGSPYNTMFDEVLSEYKGVADFYFGNPSGINAISI
ncbi:hypothetical protein [Ulvibacter litoralis]|uniref:Uncharacterized protein n=1 Tax=Ulvibacter litoralis TaxID=227084 RepID=A0A1G7HI83_9FLAO|nr:hypothetical protein [Ulvibacter litoralis]GHC57879.1 hypothetical protein GCM10008083_23140 [Ulvibacter litoralis]SDF00036.1 hypothetical protein SAMN05421855_104104 [Ulvibacter litoralis]